MADDFYPVFGDLPEGLQEVFWHAEGADYFEDREDQSIAEAYYAMGFGFRGEEYDQMGLDPDAVKAARDAYFDHMQMNEDQFPWDEWREAMGYEDA